MPKINAQQESLALVSESEEAPLSQFEEKVAAALRKLGQREVHPQGDAARLAGLAFAVLDRCGIRLDGSMIELHDGSLITDMMAVRAYQELQRAAGQLGVSQERIASNIDDANEEFQADLEGQFDAMGLEGSRRGGDALHLGPEDGDRKGVFR